MPRIQAFVPIEDLNRIPADASLLVPYQVGVLLASEGLEADQSAGRQPVVQSRDSTSSSPGDTPSASATPALSSSTYMAGRSLR